MKNGIISGNKLLTDQYTGSGNRQAKDKYDDENQTKHVLFFHRLKI